MLRKQIIGILVNKNSGETRADLAVKHNLSLIFFTPEDIDWQRRTVTGLYRTRCGLHYKKVALPSVIYNRLYPHNSEIIERLTAMRPPAWVFNQVTLFDKWTIYKHLSQTDLNQYLPRTYEYDMAVLHEALLHHDRIVIKPRMGRQGAGLWRLSAKPNGQLLIEHELPLPITLPYSDAIINLLHILIVPYTMIIQEYIDLAAVSNAPFDIRALVQKNGAGHWQVTAVTSRVAENNQYITNIYQQILLTEQLLRENNYPAEQILTQVEELSIKTAEVLEQALGHLGEICVDIGLDQNNKPWIIEVNGKPDKQIYEELNNPDLINRVHLTPLEYAHYLNTQKRRF